MNAKKLLFSNALIFGAYDAVFNVQHSSAGKCIPRTLSGRFCQALTRITGGAATLYELGPGAGHGTSEFSTNPNLAKFLAFFNSNLK